MPASYYLISGLTFAAAAGLCVYAAGFAVTSVETASETGVRGALDTADLGWAEVQADGLRVTLTGTAPTEAARFDAMTTAGRIVDAARVIDQMDVTPAMALAAPRFSAEILRNDRGISIIGLIPGSTDRDALRARLADIAGDLAVADFLETAEYPVPDGWDDAMGFAMRALENLPRSKVSVFAGHVDVTAISDSQSERGQLERTLSRAAPPALNVALNIAAPRPVITPYTLRYVLDANGGRFDACSAPDDDATAIILDAATAAGLTGSTQCTIGLGVPSDFWATAAAQSIAALAALGGGTVTINDADISLVSAEGVAAPIFDRIIGELETGLPDVFALRAILPAPEDENDAGPPEFTATRSPEGLVQLRGRVPDATFRDLADGFAKARFGSENVYTAARVVEDLPAGWGGRVLSGLEALGFLENGVVSVTPDLVSVRGVSQVETASADLSRLFATKLGEGATYDLAITYRAPPAPEVTEDAPAPEVCEADIANIIDRKKITFEPGSATVDEGSQDTIDAIAEILIRCSDYPLEIQGHTDSQGRESMNLALSQDRANAVLAELRARDVLTARIRAQGYGESEPIADNGTEDGREANRRIQFRLIRPSVESSEETTLDSLSADAAQDDPAAQSTDATQEPAANDAD